MVFKTLTYTISCSNSKPFRTDSLTCPISYESNYIALVHYIIKVFTVYHYSLSCLFISPPPNIKLLHKDWKPYISYVLLTSCKDISYFRLICTPTAFFHHYDLNENHMRGFGLAGNKDPITSPSSFV